MEEVLVVPTCKCFDAKRDVNPTIKFLPKKEMVTSLSAYLNDHITFGLSKFRPP
jgi:hypothetical protein